MHGARPTVKGDKRTVHGTREQKPVRGTRCKVHGKKTRRTVQGIRTGSRFTVNIDKRTEGSEVYGLRSGYTIITVKRDDRTVQMKERGCGAWFPISHRGPYTLYLEPWLLSSQFSEPAVAWPSFKGGSAAILYQGDVFSGSPTSLNPSFCKCSTIVIKTSCQYRIIFLQTARSAFTGNTFTSCLSLNHFRKLRIEKPTTTPLSGCILTKKSSSNSCATAAALSPKVTSKRSPSSS